MKIALRSGLGVMEFWDLTPRETFAAIEAAIWRDEQDQKRVVALARSIAVLSRAKRIPSLKQLLSRGPAKPLRGAELERRREEFADMTKALQGVNLTLRKARPGHELK